MFWDFFKQVQWRQHPILFLVSLLRSIGTLMCPWSVYSDFWWATFKTSKNAWSFISHLFFWKVFLLLFFPSPSIWAILTSDDVLGSRRWRALTHSASFHSKNSSLYLQSDYMWTQLDQSLFCYDPIKISVNLETLHPKRQRFCTLYIVKNGAM